MGDFHSNDAVDVQNLPDEVIWSLNKAKEVLLQQGEVVLPGGLKPFHIFGGIAFGLAAGAAGGYFIAQRLLETKYNKIAETEIAEMREHYKNKEVARENTAAKEDLEDIIREKGYSVATPMAVTPPAAVVEAAANAAEEAEVPKIVKEVKPIEVRNVFAEARVIDTWQHHKELAKRSPVRPYVIHYDEREERPYEEGTLTYYDADDVLCDEHDEVIGKDDRDQIIGEANLNKFGHGSNDASIVYIRNDRLETQYEVVRSPNSYAEEVHGFEHADTKRYRKRRISDDDE